MPANFLSGSLKILLNVARLKVKFFHRVKQWINFSEISVNLELILALI